MYDKEEFYHGTNERGTPRLSALIADHGMVGYGRYWVLVEMLAGEPDFKVPYEGWFLRALVREWACSPSEVRDLIKTMSDEYELIKIYDKYIQLNW